LRAGKKPTLITTGKPKNTNVPTVLLITLPEPY